MQVVEPQAILMAHTPDPESLIERAGRVCWKSEGRITPDSHIAFIKMLKGKNHQSVLEHASATFKIITDRGISHEIVRHRLASYSQESTRYCRYMDSLAVVRPSGLEIGSDEHLSWLGMCSISEIVYNDLLRNGVKPEIARSVLPTCLKTEVVMTANFREWLHFLEMRTSPGAHPDIRIIANMIAKELFKIAPTVFEEYANA